MKTKVLRETSLKKWKWKMWERSCRARLPSKSESWRCESEALVRDFLQIKIWKPKSENENEAFVRDFPQHLKVEDTKRSFRARLPSNFESSNCENEAWTRSSNAGPIRPWSEHSRHRLAPVRLTSFPVLLPRHVLSCKTQHFVHLIYYLSKTPFMRDFPQKVKVEDMKTKVLRETSLKKSKWKMYIWRCEDEAFVRDFPQKVKVEDVKTKLSCEPSLKELKRKMWERSCRARLPSKSGSSKQCENEAFVRDFLSSKCENGSLNLQFQCGADPTMIQA